MFAGSFCSHLHLHALTPPFASPILQLVPPLMLLIKPFQQHQKQHKGFEFIVVFSLQARALRISILKRFCEPNKILTGDGCINLTEDLTNQRALRGRPRDYERERASKSLHSGGGTRLVKNPDLTLRLYEQPWPLPLRSIFL